VKHRVEGEKRKREAKNWGRESWRMREADNESFLQTRGKMHSNHRVVKASEKNRKRGGDVNKQPEKPKRGGRQARRR